MQRWEHYERRWETHRANLENQQSEYQRLCQLLEGIISNGPKAIEGSSETLLIEDHPGSLKINRSIAESSQIRMKAGLEPNENIVLERSKIHEISQFPAHQVRSLLSSRAWVQTPTGGRRKLHPPLPTRVLDVGDEGTDVRLYESAAEEHADYAALSYCWGGTASIVNSMTTHNDRKKRIPWDVLPRLFQDVITVTRQLRIRYVWIDVLCIIQDDVHDWERESGKMASIFGNATVAIVAGSTPHPSFPLILPTVQIEAPRAPADAAPSGLIVQSKDPLYNALTHGLSSSNCYKRAWMLQESFLAQSVLHFVAGRVIFEEPTGLTGLMPGCREDQLQLLPHPDNHVKKLCMSLFAEPSLPAEILDLWWHFVEQYSLMKLTFQSDKLVAISGQADKFSSALGTYTAGLWPQHDFVRSLCWQLRSTSVQSAAYVAPSWSWAALDGPVFAPIKKQSIICAELVKYECIPLGQNQFGALKRAELTLRAPYVEFEVRGQDNTHDVVRGISQCLVYAQKDSMGLTFELDTFKTFHYGMKLACLRMLEDVDGDLTCLVLMPVLDGCWERIAVMQMQRRRGEHRWFGSAVEREFVIV
jgi:hypothetical protein